MKNVSNCIIILLLFATISCNRNNADNNSIIGSNNSYIDTDSDSTFYKLDIYTKNDKYLRYSKDKLTFLITRKITAFDKDFENTANGWREAINYYRTNKNASEKRELYMITTVAIKNKKGNFDNIWTFNNPMYEYKEKDGKYTYGYVEFNVLLDKSYNDERLSIIFKTPDYGDGYRQYTLTYENDGELWKLISREKIQTGVSNKFDKIRYCIDTVNSSISEYQSCESDKFSFEFNYVTDVWGDCY